MNFEKMRCELHLLFDDGDRISNKQLKSLLKKLYRKYGINRTATGTQIKEFGFTTHKCKILTENGRLDGQELTKIK